MDFELTGSPHSTASSRCWHEDIRQPAVPQCRASATLRHVDPNDQTLFTALHSESLLAAERAELQPLIDHLRGVAQGRDDIRVE